MEGTDAFPSWNPPANGFCSMPNPELYLQENEKDQLYF